MKHLLLIVVAVFALSACGAERETASGGPNGSPEPGALQDVARVVCQVENGPPVVEFPTVKPQPDGVHFQVVNETGKDLSFSIEDPSGGGMGGVDAPGGASFHVVDLSPGNASIACYDGSTADGSEVGKTALEIVDQDGVWIPATLTCARRFYGSADHAAGARGKSDPLEAAREGLHPYMQADDIVEPAGYPEAETPVFRLVRAGHVLAIVELQDDGAGGWLPSDVTGCSSL